MGSGGHGTGIYREDTRALINILQCRESPHDKELPGPDVNSAEFEKSCQGFMNLSVIYREKIWRKM